MKRVLYWTVGLLLAGAVFGASLRWPGVMVWVAWMAVAYLAFNAYALSEELGQLEASRDKWRILTRKTEAERNAAERQLTSREAEIEEYKKVISRFAGIVEEKNAELARLRPYADPRLFAAARRVSEVAGKGSDEEVDLALVMLTEAVAWWEALPAVAGEDEREAR